jgi:hypothetical protein
LIEITKGEKNAMLVEAREWGQRGLGTASRRDDGGDGTSEVVVRGFFGKLVLVVLFFLCARGEFGLRQDQSRLAVESDDEGLSGIE